MCSAWKLRTLVQSPSVCGSIIGLLQTEECDPDQSHIKRPYSAGQTVIQKGISEKNQSSIPQRDLYRRIDCSSLESIEDISKDLPSSAILSHLLTEPITTLEKQKLSKHNRKHHKIDTISNHSEDSNTLSEISSTDTLDAKIKKLIEDSKKCKEIQKEVEDMINSSKEQNLQEPNHKLNETQEETCITTENERVETSLEECRKGFTEVFQIQTEKNEAITKDTSCGDNETTSHFFNNSRCDNYTTLENNCKLALTPGLKSKPPLPKKSQIPKIVIEPCEPPFQYNSSKNFTVQQLTNFIVGVDKNYTEESVGPTTGNSLNEIAGKGDGEFLSNSEDGSSISLQNISYNESDYQNVIMTANNLLDIGHNEGSVKTNESTENTFAKSITSNGNPVDLKVQNWIESEPEEQIANNAAFDEIQTDKSLQDLREQQIKNIDQQGDTSDNNCQILGDKPNKKSSRKKDAKENNNRKYKIQDFRKIKRTNNESKEIISSLDKMFGSGDGVNTNVESEFLELYLRSQGETIRTKNSKKKSKNSTTASIKNGKTKSKTISKNAQKSIEDLASNRSDVESWMSCNRESKLDIFDKEKTLNHKKGSNFTDFLDNINEIEMTTIPISNRIMDCNTGSKPSVNDGGDDPYDEIVSVLKTLEDVDKKSHESMECMKGIAERAVRLPSKENAARNNENGERERPDGERKIPCSSNACQGNYSDGNNDNTKLTGIASERNNEDIFSSSNRQADKSSINLKEIMSYLDEVDKNYSKSINSAKEGAEIATVLIESTLQLDNIPKTDDLILLAPSDLARQVVDLHIRLKDKSSSIALLQRELSILREQVTKMTRQTDEIVKQKLKSQKEEYEAVVKRHQKFIDQLIADKKTLNQQCESLIHEMKVLEERFNCNMRAVDHRHRVELQKVKDMQKADEKIRREKWMDNKTQKIKELTVKSLEPELEKMAARHQRELSELRALHKNEIEDMELRHSRKMQQQMETLREQLTEAREKAIIHEREVMRQRYEHLVETEEKNYQEQRRKLMAEHAKRQAECEERENTAYAERDRAIRQAQMDFEEKLQAMARRHSNEISVLKEKMEIDIDIFRNNYKKQQELILAEREMAIREKCRKERDKEIEAVIERLEQEASESQNQMEQTTENRIRRLREKYENEIKEVEASEREAKIKYTETKTKLAEAEDVAVNLKASIKQLEMQLQEAKEFSDKLLNERNKMKEIVREEMNVQMEKLEKELHNLKNDKEKELQQVYSRVRIAVARKDDILQELSRDHVALQEKCAYLENMLEQQRKEYLIK
ncbi:centrosomal protein of 131 kDa isoform X2 [Agrilus planipennis]|uniref:Centrosomal protein of 131 kDa isoform X2 n=1 Tax=Agrilus planipennis TaxID=224129 RepID=A0A7F5RAU3_AGRPL|nr:centrosomal protein of 131 kDa isoform X2 [Agrilus planipennis]